MRALLLAFMVGLLLLVGACLRVREQGDPAAAANVIRAQIASTPSAEAAAPSGTPEPAATPTVVTTAAAATATAEPTATTAAPTSTAVVAATVAVASPTMVACRRGAFEDALDVEVEERDDDAGGPNNNIKVCNRKDERLRVRGRIQLNKIGGDTVRPVNDSLAWARCTDCSTFAVALQINLVKRNASTQAPVNKATAYNYECTRCKTFAIAYQYVHPVDDPRQVPDNVRRLVNEMNHELQAIHGDSGVTVLQAAQRIDAVVAHFTELNANLTKLQDQTEERTSPGGDRDD